MNFQIELLSSLKKNAGNIAIEKGNKSISYSELLESSQKVTNYLLKKDIGKESVIGLLVEDRISLIVAMIGVINAGCVFVPLDRTLPEERLNLMVKDLGLNYAIVGNPNEIIFLGLESFFELDKILNSSLTEPTIFPEYSSEDSLYIYFTSGSTGRPKGVIGKNKSLLQFIQWEIKYLEIEETFRFSQFISPYFDAFLRDVFVPLFSGGTICIPPSEDDFFTPEKMSLWITDHQISLIHCVPSVFKIFSSEELLKADCYPSLKFILLSGEKIIPNSLEKWFEKIGDRIQLINLYGLTETTMIRCSYKIKASDINKSRMPIGKPIADTEILITDSSLKPNNVLIPGDLYIISEFITKGYLNNEALNRERFIEIGPGVIGFKTGDKARLLPDGNIELIGREDRQVKLRGIRIELDEIEYLISNSGLVEKVVVMTSDDSPDASIICYVKWKPQLALDNFILANLEAYMKQTVPLYMMPTRIIEIDSFPLLSSGKLDFKKLIEISETLDRHNSKPTNETEEKLLDIWKGILAKEDISIDESFLTVGGNSLSLMRLVAKIYTVFGIRIPLKDLFSNLTITSQSNYIIKSKKDTDPYRIKISPEKEYYPITSTQKRMYLNFDLDRSSTKYNLPYVVRIKKDIDKNKIERILKFLISRHETLRTVFKITDEGVFQVIQESIEFEFENSQVSEIDEGIKKFIRPFNLNKGPLIRAGILTDQENQDYLIVDIHHIICDGISQRNLFTEFLYLYSGRELEKLPIQFKDFAEWEQEFITSPEYTALREFWINSLDVNSATLNLPLLNDFTLDKVSMGSNTVFHIEKELFNGLMEDMLKENITSFSVLYTCFISFLSQISGQDKFNVGIAASGRLQEEVQPLIGMFVKTLPIMNKIDFDKSFFQTAIDINDFLSEAINKQLYDLIDMMSNISNNRQIGNEELFNVMFTFQNYGADQRYDQQDDFELFYFKRSEAKFPINFIVSELKDSYEVSFEYSLAFFEEKDIDRLINSFKKMIEKLSKDPYVQMFDLVMDQGEMENTSESDITFNF